MKKNGVEESEEYEKSYISIPKNIKISNFNVIKIISRVILSRMKLDSKNFWIFKIAILILD